MSAQLPAEPLVRTRLVGNRVCSLTGRWIEIEVNIRPIRAWAGIVKDATGGPAAEIVRARQQLPASVVSGLDNDNLFRDTEVAARKHHCRQFTPKYFDGVLIEYANGCERSEFVWCVDYDIDQQMNDESRITIRAPADRPQDHSAESLRVSLCRDDFNSAWQLRFAPSSDIANEGEPAVTTNVADARNGPPILNSLPTTDSTRSSDMPLAEKIPELVAQLHGLDEAAIRKQHLELVVDAANSVLAAIDRADKDHRPMLIDALYRKGRALGYMELPDVVARKPVADPPKLQTEFEATFQRLDALVDTRDSEYILLRIRRERRLDRRGIALNLVDLYRCNHADPVWYYKKRLDLLTELGADIHAHEAAAELWLNARLPRRPIPVVFRLEANDSTADVVPIQFVVGSFQEPFQGQELDFHRTSGEFQEAELWLYAGQTIQVSGFYDESGEDVFRGAGFGQVIELTRGETKM